MNKEFSRFLENNFLNNTVKNITNSTDISDENILNIIFLKFHYIWILFILVHLFYFIFMIIKMNCCKKNLLHEEGEANERRRINDECAICIQNITNETQLICNHSFCAPCILNYGKHTFNLVDILCPICRGKSKILFANFERNEENKEYYDQILNYNHEFTQNNFTSLCFCIDFLRLFYYYMKQISNLDNPRYRSQRSCLFLICIIMLIYFILLFSHNFKNLFEIVEEIFYYLIFIFTIAEYFYRNFRQQTNAEYEIYGSNENQSENNNDNISEINNNVNLNVNDNV